jgi:hypothetical protein
MKEFIILICIIIILFIVLYIFNNTVEQFAEAPVVIDPMMVLLRGILTVDGSKPLNPSISDSTLRFFAEDAGDTGNVATFMLNIGGSNINWPSDKSFSSLLSVVVNPPADKPLMAALNGFLDVMIKPTIPLSELEASFKKAAVDNTLTKETTMKFMMDTMSENLWNPTVGGFILYILGIFKKAYDAENAVKTGAATRATYEPANAVDPLMVLMKSFLTAGSRSIDGRITDSKLRFFADNAFKTGDLSLFKRNVDPKYIEDDTIKSIINFILDPAITTSTDPIMAVFIKELNEDRKRRNLDLPKDKQQKLITLPLSQVRRSFDRATYPAMTYSGIKPLIEELGILEAKDINNEQISGITQMLKPYKAAADAEREIAAKKASAAATLAAETALTTQKTASETALSSQKTAAETALAAAKEAAKKELDDAKAAAKKELDDAKAALVDAKKDAADTALAAKTSAEKVLALEKAAAAANTAAEAKAIADAKAIAEKDAAQKAVAAKEAADVKAAAEKDAADKAAAKADADKAAAKAAAEKAAADKADAKATVKAAADKADAKNGAPVREVTTGITQQRSDMAEATTGDTNSSNVGNVQQNGEPAAVSAAAKVQNRQVANSSRISPSALSSASSSASSSAMPPRMALRVPASIITESDDTMLETDLSEMDLSEMDLSETDLSEMATYPNAIQQNTNSRSTMQQQNTIPLVEMPKPMRRSMQPSRPSCSSNCQDEYSDDYTEDCN